MSLSAFDDKVMRRVSRGRVGGRFPWSRPSATDAPKDAPTPTHLAWDVLAQTYDDSRNTDAVYMSCVRSAVRALAVDCRPGLVLDAGAGTGLATGMLLKGKATVVAMDFSKASLDLLRAKYRGQNVLIVQADVSRLPFRDESFGSVLCANTLQHLAPSAQSQAAEELQRITATGGRLVVTVHQFSRDKQRSGWIKVGKPGQPGIDYIFRFLPNELQRLFPTAKLQALGFYGLARLPRLGALLQDPIARWFGTWLWRWRLGHMLLARIDKA